MVVKIESRTGQAIRTQCISDHHGSRVKATAQAGTVTIEWNDALNSEKNHAAAAAALIKKLDWSGRWCGGGLPDGTTCWVRVEDEAS